MKTIDPIGLREKNLERIAARHGLTFYLDGKFMVSSSGWDTTTREATDEEITMWAIISLENPDSLQASPDEIKASWENLKGPFTINAKDYHGLKGCGPNYFVPEDNKHNLMLGMIGHFQGKEVYVSKVIHVGFFYEGPRIPELHWHPNPHNRYEVEPEISAEVELRVWNTLYPFKLTT